MNLNQDGFCGVEKEKADHVIFFKRYSKFDQEEEVLSVL